MTACPHDLTEREIAVTADGACPLCLAAEVARLREALVAQARRGAVRGDLCWCDNPRGVEEGTGEREPHSAHCLIARAALAAAPGER